MKRKAILNVLLGQITSVFIVFVMALIAIISIGDKWVVWSKKSEAEIYSFGNSDKYLRKEKAESFFIIYQNYIF